MVTSLLLLHWLIHLIKKEQVRLFDQASIPWNVTINLGLQFLSSLINQQNRFSKQKPSYKRPRLPVLSAMKLCLWNTSKSCWRPSSVLPWFSATLSPGSTSLQPSSTFSGSLSNLKYAAKSFSLRTNHFLTLCLRRTASKNPARTLAWSPSLSHADFLGVFFFFYPQSFAPFHRETSKTRKTLSAHCNAT